MTTAMTRAQVGGDKPQREATRQATYMPQFDIQEMDEGLVLYGDMPGVGPEDIDIRFENGELSIHGKVAPRQQNVSFLYREYGVGDYHRTFAVGESIDVEKICAEMRHGVLTIHLPKSEKARPRRIEVRAE
ncbi:Hsp20/alpha crystallin family protein [Candidatus Laterigemmans baculatus]|uniref:Hsp20/alpha crystallin family protein n=1 Tax=Candidatus Laterigemmans baculatus TaxID=2770505 RepID=UPI001F2E153E|nr:Hsp20/alpha crystallin family protein [Candidatus Laterigemmans baculatus]